MPDNGLEAWRKEAVAKGLGNGSLVRNVSGKLLGVGE